ncbi:hypothetical protein ACFYPA_02230 [Streptomyces sp. NPDC005775]|uniref:hypothetical protein n=1 Tax=unclassified Streptomyces TaxID=2593676 RepID=UPI00340259BF
MDRDLLGDAVYSLAKVRAGMVWQLNDKGCMGVLDTSARLSELRSRVDHIIDRIAANSRLTAAAGLGTPPRPHCLPAALCNWLSARWTPSSAIRLARTHKCAVLLCMEQRLHQAGKAEGWPAGETLAARLMWGPHTDGPC